MTRLVSNEGTGFTMCSRRQALGRILHLTTHCLAGACRQASIHCGREDAVIKREAARSTMSSYRHLHCRFCCKINHEYILAPAL
ncbi:hypothetical protein ACET3Z_016554 [Daucus carota]